MPTTSWVRISLCFAIVLTTLPATIAFGEEAPQAVKSEKETSKETTVKKQPKDSFFALGALLGAQADPTQFAFGLHADFHLTPYFSLGPLLQVGVFDTRTYFTATGGGKVHLPFFDVPNLNLSLQAGAGYFLRRVTGLNLHNFVFLAGGGFDYALTQEVVLQSLFLVNVTNDIVDEVFYSALVGAKYLF